jgi:outer membrane autotransporter protein
VASDSGVTSYAPAFADAGATGVQQDVNGDTNYKGRESDATVSNDGSINAFANAFGEASAYADAVGSAKGVSQRVGGKTGFSEDSFALVENTSALSIQASSYVTALAITSAYADSLARGVDQRVRGADAQGEVFNGVDGEYSGYIASFAYADAKASGVANYQSPWTPAAVADATSQGVNQNVAGRDTSLAQVYNEEGSTILGVADAYVEREGLTLQVDRQGYRLGSYYANADADGVQQFVTATYQMNATALVDNEGHIEGIAHAEAVGKYFGPVFDTFDGYNGNVGSIDADAYADGIEQNLRGDGFGQTNTVYGIVYNTSLLSIVGKADASAYGMAQDGDAFAQATGVDQYGVNSDNVDFLVENDGLIAGYANSYATSTGENQFRLNEADSEAVASGVWQWAEAESWGESGKSVELMVDNNAGASILAQESSYAFSAHGSADSYASAVGVYQEVEDTAHGEATIENDSLIAAYAMSTANSGEDGAKGFPATAIASGGYQYFDDVSGPETAFANFSNTAGNEPVDILSDNWGKMSEGFNQGMRGEALAIGENGTGAAAAAFGHRIVSDDGEAGGFIVNGDNSGDITGLATASTTGQAYVRAYGLDIHTQYEGDSATAVNGEVNNDGYIGAKGVASSGEVFIEAVGVHVESNENNLTLTNRGTIEALAHVASATDYYSFGGAQPGPNATAILFTDETGESNGDGNPEIINAGGNIWAGISQDGEVTRGNAINMLRTSDNVPITFGGAQFAGSGGDGYVSGDILIKDGDSIDVVDGTTWFDGGVNWLANEALGEMNIYRNGKLVLRQTAFDNANAATVQVENFNLESDGRLALELTPGYAHGEYGQVFAQNNANLDGTIVAIYEANTYDDEFRYEGVVRTGFGGTISDGGLVIEDNSALLATDYEINDSDRNLDLVVTRQGFGALSGLTKNQSSVGDAIEKVYGKSGGTDDWNDLVANLFILNEDDYPPFLNQLGGAEYAQMLKSVLWANRGLNRVIYERMSCDRNGIYENTSTTVNGMNVQPAADLAPVATGCFTPETASLWMRGYGSWNKQDGDQNAPGFKEDQYGILFGMDYAFDEVWFAGIAGGYFNSDLDYNSWGARRGASGKYDGWQIAGYGGYDNSESYARAILAYGVWDTKVNRDIQYPGASLIDPVGKPDANTLSFYAEGGHRFIVGDGATLTPYLGLNFAQGKLEGARENDPYGTGAALRIHNSKADSFATVLGGRFEGNWGDSQNRLTPYVSFAWEHEFDPTSQKVKMSFAEAPSGATFKARSAKTNRDSALVGVGGNWVIDNNMDFGVGYDGRFNSDYTSHSVTGRFGFKF